MTRYYLTVLAFLSALSSSPLSRASDLSGADELNDARFQQLHKELQSGNSDVWRTIPWQTDLLTAQRQAKQAGKPIFIWAMDGHPLGCTWNNGVLDRASTFAHPEIVALLKESFVPVAIDQANTRRQQDTEGDFYRELVYQRDDKKKGLSLPLTVKTLRNPISFTTQGFYIATAAGDLLLYNNNRDPDKVLRLMRERLAEFAPTASRNADAVSDVEIDRRYNITPPPGGLVVRVQAKILGGYEPTDDRWQKVFQSAVSRDNLWISKAEHEAIVSGEMPETLGQRIARFHLVDNTRGEPLMWKPEEVKQVKLELKDGEVQGNVLIESEDGTRGYDAKLRGKIEVVDGKVLRFDIVALGQCWGEGPYTKNAPSGKFPLAISFALADGSDIADGLIPQGARGWVDGYLSK